MATYYNVATVTGAAANAIENAIRTHGFDAWLSTYLTENGTGVLTAQPVDSKPWSVGNALLGCELRGDYGLYVHAANLFNHKQPLTVRITYVTF